MFSGLIQGNSKQPKAEYHYTNKPHYSLSDFENKSLFYETDQSQCHPGKKIHVLMRTESVC